MARDMTQIVVGFRIQSLHGLGTVAGVCTRCENEHKLSEMERVRTRMEPVTALQDVGPEGLDCMQCGDIVKPARPWELEETTPEPVSDSVREHFAVIHVGGA